MNSYQCYMPCGECTSQCYMPCGECTSPLSTGRAGDQGGASPKPVDAQQVMKRLAAMNPCLAQVMRERLNIPLCASGPTSYIRGYADGGSSCCCSSGFSWGDFLKGAGGVLGSIGSGLSSAGKGVQSQSSCLSRQFDMMGGCKPVLHNSIMGTEPLIRDIYRQIYPEISGHTAYGMASGGLPARYAQAAPKGHNPEFITGVTGYYAQGGGTGQSDDITAMLHDGDYVVDADTVAAFGDGSSKAGAQVLHQFMNQVQHPKRVGANPVPAKIADGEFVLPESFVTALGQGDNKRGGKLLDVMRKELREHKRAASINSIPPKAKTPFEYIRKAFRQ